VTIAYSDSIREGDTPMHVIRTFKFSRLARFLDDRQADVAEEEGAESGFTLIELMVVLLIMAILMAIAIPTFLGVRSGAQDRSAQSDLTNAIISGKTIITNQGAYPTELSMLSGLQSSEPELNFTNALALTSGTPHTINVQVSPDGQIVFLADESADQRCWYAEDNEEAQPGQVGGLAAAKVTTAQGISYNGTPKGTTTTLGCGYTDTYITTAVGWGPTYPS